MPPRGLALARRDAPHGVSAIIQPFANGAVKSVEMLARAVSEERVRPPLSFSPHDAAVAGLPPLLRARVERLAGQLQMIDESIRRQLQDGPVR